MSNTKPVIPDEYRTRYVYATQLLINLLGRREEFASIWDQYTQEVSDIERIARLTSDLAAANLRVEGLEKERDKANLDANTLDAENNLLRNQMLIDKDWYEHQIAIVNGANLELEARVEQLSGPVTEIEAEPEGN